MTSYIHSESNLHEKDLVDLVNFSELFIVNILLINITDSFGGIFSWTCKNEECRELVCFALLPQRKAVKL